MCGDIAWTIHAQSYTGYNVFLTVQADGDEKRFPYCYFRETAGKI